MLCDQEMLAYKDLTRSQHLSKFIQSKKKLLSKKPVKFIIS